MNSSDAGNDDLPHFDPDTLDGAREQLRLAEQDVRFHKQVLAKCQQTLERCRQAMREGEQVWHGPNGDLPLKQQINHRLRQVAEQKQELEHRNQQRDQAAARVRDLEATPMGLHQLREEVDRLPRQLEQLQQHRERQQQNLAELRSAQAEGRPCAGPGKPSWRPQVPTDQEIETANWWITMHDRRIAAAQQQLDTKRPRLAELERCVGPSSECPPPLAAPEQTSSAAREAAPGAGRVTYVARHSPDPMSSRERFLALSPAERRQLLDRHWRDLERAEQAAESANHSPRPRPAELPEDPDAGPDGPTARALRRIAHQEQARAAQRQRLEALEKQVDAPVVEAPATAPFEDRIVHGEETEAPDGAEPAGPRPEVSQYSKDLKVDALRGQLVRHDRQIQRQQQRHARTEQHLIDCRTARAEGHVLALVDGERVPTEQDLVQARRIEQREREILEHLRAQRQTHLQRLEKMKNWPVAESADTDPQTEGL